ncbi:hypothetical protein DKX38_003805 [Salix brachista]|uniref:Uncharacterized protein n=1 Tax=Salix brachista TaxID=2182728 RepID=A0A5N5NBB0_9ROSI|nr:hypothetical protein DKX38_003805 [Salix brachista]
MRLKVILMDIDAFVLLSELTVLSLKNNSISGNMVNFSSNNKMKLLDLSGNKLYDSIPRSLLGLKLLESVLLQYNYSKGDPQLYGPPTLNTCKNIFATVDVADDQNRESSTAEPPGQSSVPNSAKIFGGLIAVGFVVAILLFFIYFKKARKLQKKGSRKVEERKGGGEQQHGTWFFDGLEDEENPVKSIEEKKGKVIMDGHEAVVVKRIRDLKPLSSEEFTRQLHIIAHQKPSQSATTSSRMRSCWYTNMQRKVFSNNK